MCGEKVLALLFQLLLRGSPPRVRGKVDDAETGDLIHRITPACAGKRQNITTIYCVCQDHPRVCGEKVGPGRASHEGMGSPPRVRGKD